MSTSLGLGLQLEVVLEGGVPGPSEHQNICSWRNCPHLAYNTASSVRFTLKLAFFTFCGFFGAPQSGDPP